MPRYQCHKQVYALKIATIERHVYPEETPIAESAPSLTLTFTEPRYAPMEVDHNMIARYMPVPGDYYVVYDDGYKSFSPAKAFEEGYTRIVAKSRPTIEELEQILNSEPQGDITINPDGSISAGSGSLPGNPIGVNYAGK